MSARLLIPAVLLLALVGLGLAGYLRRRRRVARALGQPLLLRRTLGVDLAAAPWPRLATVLAATALLAVALTDPRWGAPAPPSARAGAPVVLVLDASTSMLTPDVAPSRLAVERALADSLVAGLPDTPIGLVVFAGRAYALAPPTLDRGALRLYLDAVEPRMVTQSGSSMAAAVRQAVSLLAAGRRAGGAVVLISDGDALEAPDAVLEPLRLARGLDIPVYTLGVGTEAGAPVPRIDFATGAIDGVITGPDGQPVVSRLRPQRLEEIARATGASFRAAGPGMEMAPLLARLRTASAGEVPGAGAPERPARYGYFAAGALLLLLGEGAALRFRRERAA